MTATPKIIKIEFLSLLLDHVHSVYLDNTDDFGTIAAFDLVRIMLDADECVTEKQAVAAIDEMAIVADCILHNELSADIRTRLERIRDASPMFGEPETAAVE